MLSSSLLRLPLGRPGPPGLPGMKPFPVIPPSDFSVLEITGVFFLADGFFMSPDQRPNVLDLLDESRADRGVVLDLVVQALK